MKQRVQGPSVPGELQVAPSHLGLWHEGDSGDPRGWRGGNTGLSQWTLGALGLTGRARGSDLCPEGAWEAGLKGSLFRQKISREVLVEDTPQDL